VTVPDAIEPIRDVTELIEALCRAFRQQGKVIPSSIPVQKVGAVSLRPGRGAILLVTNRSFKFIWFPSMLATMVSGGRLVQSLFGVLICNPRIAAGTHPKSCELKYTRAWIREAHRVSGGGVPSRSGRNLVARQVQAVRDMSHTEALFRLTVGNKRSGYLFV
jgi:hypothetical protein